MSLRFHHRRLTGYTLIELLVVIVIIGLLTSMATVSYNRVQLTARDNTRKTNVIDLAHAVEQYYTVNKKLPGKVNGTVPTENLRCEKKDDPTNAASPIYYSYTITNEEGSCNNFGLQNTQTYTFNPSEWSPYPVWIPGLGTYINPFPIEPNLVIGDPLKTAGSRTYVYRHLSNGYMVYTALESTTKSEEDKNQYKGSTSINTSCSKYGSPQANNSTDVLYVICQ